MNRAEAGTVPRSHVLVEAFDSICTRELAEFLVHIMCTGAGIVTEPDAKDLDLQRPLLVNLRNKGSKRKTKSQRVCYQSRPPAT